MGDDYGSGTERRTRVDLALHEIYTQACKESANIYELFDNVECRLDPQLRGKVSRRLISEFDSHLEGKGRAFNTALVKLERLVASPKVKEEVRNFSRNLHNYMREFLGTTHDSDHYPVMLYMLTLRMLDPCAYDRAVHAGKWAPLETLAVRYLGRPGTDGEEKDVELPQRDMMAGGVLHNCFRLTPYVDKLPDLPDIQKAGKRDYSRDERITLAPEGIKILDRLGVPLTKVSRNAISDHAAPTALPSAIVGTAREFDIKAFRPEDVPEEEWKRPSWSEVFEEVVTNLYGDPPNAGPELVLPSGILQELVKH